MGVYINGMEMPLNCSDCPMCYDMMECTVAEPIISFCKEEPEQFDFCTERHPRCPLVPVPPHGRLIDADALCKTLRSIAENEYTPRVFANWIEYHIDTIIPAEEE